MRLLGKTIQCNILISQKYFRNLSFQNSKWKSLMRNFTKKCRYSYDGSNGTKFSKSKKKQQSDGLTHKIYMIFIKETVDILDENYVFMSWAITVLFLIRFGKTEYIVEFNKTVCTFCNL